jgi:5-methyltetrahydrofolate--homocysteine methyltransferase
MRIQSVYQAVLEYDSQGVIAAIRSQIEMGTNVSQVVKDGLVPALDEVGKRFSEGELYVPEMLMAAKAVKAGMDIIRPIVSEGKGSYVGTIIIGTVKGDLHDIGKNLVAMMLEGGGFNVIDLGVDVKKEDFFEATRKNKGNMVALSALLTTTMSAMRETVAYIKDRDRKISVIVGGAPVDQAYCDSISADGYADDAAIAVKVARSLID